MFDITSTFLELGDSTSQNLEFSHDKNVHISYGEETITENNLLEIRRRHHKVVEIFTTTKDRESKIGADWEWRIIGRIYTYKMRVQAKRIGCQNKLTVKYEVNPSKRQQRDLLIEHAKKDKMKPLYCIYSTERQRRIWNEFRSSSGFRSFQAGCLLADASDVPVTTKKLEDIEKKCIPWHYLFSRQIWMYKESEYSNGTTKDSTRSLSSAMNFQELDKECSKLLEYSGWDPPTIEDLNEKTGRNFDWTGVEETTGRDLDFARYPEDFRNYFKENGVYRILMMDVSRIYRNS